MKPISTNPRTPNWLKYLVQRIGISASDSRRNRRSIDLHRMMVTTRKPI
jgi:hypothetical protein